jgi:hypothetical protein
MRAVEFPPLILAEPTPKLAEIFPNWPNFAQIGAQKSESVAEIKLRAFDHFGRKQNYGVFDFLKIDQLTLKCMASRI